MGSKVDITELTLLVMMMHYVPQLCGELALFFICMIYENYTDYKLKRINFIPTLENGFFVVGYGIVPGTFLGMMTLMSDDG